MKILLIILYTIVFSSARGQGNSDIVKFIDNDDTSEYRSYQSTMSEHGLQPLYQSTFKTHYRIQSVNQFIEIREASFWEGELKSYVYELVDNEKENSTNRHYNITLHLDSSQLNRIVALLDLNKFQQTPSIFTEDTSDFSWCLHSPYNRVEIYDGKYYFRDYEFCSRNENSQTISKLIDTIFEIANAEQQNINLKEQVPFERYTFDGYRAAYINSTKKARRAYLKERNNYRRETGIPNKPQK